MRQLRTMVLNKSTRRFPVVWMGGVSLLLLLILFGCASESEEKSCERRLDNSEFTSVAADSSCSYYERGSAELGLAGFRFATFLKDEASDNFPSVFGLTPTGCDTTGDDALGGSDTSYSSYKSIYQKHFHNAQYWTRKAAGANRGNPEKEISLFATLSELIVQNHCEIDRGAGAENLNGTISEAERKAFTQIDTGSSSTGSSSLTPTKLIQIVNKTGKVVIYDTSGDTSCSGDPTFEGIWRGAGVGCDLTNDIASGTPFRSASVIAHVDGLQQLFSPTSTVDSVTKPFDFLNLYTAKAKVLQSDLSDLGIKQGDDLYKNVSETVDKMDNGGTCAGTSVAVLGLLTTIIRNAWKGVSATDDSTTDNYKDYNKISQEELKQIDSSQSGFSPPSCPICGNTPIDVRLVFKKGVKYTGTFKQADAGIKDTLSKLAKLTWDYDKKKLFDIRKGDGVIALKELLCFKK